MEKLINFGFKIGASEIVLKSDACQFVFTKSIDVRLLSGLCDMICSYYDKAKYCIMLDRALNNRDEILITVSPRVS